MFELTENETKAVILRRNQKKTFKEIGDTLGVSVERARKIYLAGLQKYRNEVRIVHRWKPLLRYCKANDISQRQLVRMVHLLETKFVSIDNLFPYDDFTEYKVCEIKGFGVKFQKILREVMLEYKPKTPVEEPQVNEQF